MEAQADLPAPRMQVCRGRHFSRADYQVDIAKWVSPTSWEKETGRMNHRRPPVRIAGIGDMHVAETSAGACRERFAEISERADVVALCGDPSVPSGEVRQLPQHCGYGST